MYRLTAVEHLVHRASEVRQGEVVAQLYGSNELPEGMAGPVDSVPSGGGAEALEYVGGGAPALLNRRGEAKQIVLPFTDRLERHVALDDVGDRRRATEPSRDVQMPIPEAVEPRAKIEAEVLGDGHTEVGVAMGIDGEPLEPGQRLAHGTLDRSAGLASG